MLCNIHAQHRSFNHAVIAKLIIKISALAKESENICTGFRVSAYGGGVNEVRCLGMKGFFASHYFCLCFRRLCCVYGRRDAKYCVSTMGT